MKIWAYVAKPVQKNETTSAHAYGVYVCYPSQDAAACYIFASLFLRPASSKRFTNLQIIQQLH